MAIELLEKLKSYEKRQLKQTNFGVTGFGSLLVLCIQPNSVKATNGDEAKTGYGTDQVKKRCSIVFLAGRDCSNAYNYLRSLSTIRLSSQYELIIINNGSAAIDSYAKSFLDDVKVIRPQTGLRFVQLCILAAQQGQGEYVLFSRCQIDEAWLDKTIDQLETMNMKIAIPKENNYILVNRVAFLDTGSFEGLVEKQESKQPEKKRLSYHHMYLAELNRLAGVRGKNVLAVGCHWGLECDLLVRMGAKEVTGLDVVDDVGKDYPHPQIKHVRSSAETMPFEDNSFDICSSIATLEHIPNPRAALEEMVRVTAKRGILYCFAAPLWNSAFGHHREGIFPPWIHLRKKSADEMKSYYKDRCKQIIKSRTIEAYIDEIYSESYNQTSIREYKSIVADLFRITSPIHIQFGINYKDMELLTPSILSELQDYSEDELLTDRLKLVLRKI